MTRGDICFDLTDLEIETLEKLSGYTIPQDDDADARHAFHSLMEQFARLKGIEIPDLDEDWYNNY